MKKTFGLIVAALLITQTGWAGAPCCPLKAKADKAAAVDKASSCKSSDWLAENLDLSEEQKTQLAELKDGCDASKCSVSAKKQYFEGLEKILTEEQIAKCKDLCSKDGKEGCPMTAEKETVTEGSEG